MNKFTLPLTLVAVATLAACGGHRDVRSDATVTVHPSYANLNASAPRSGTGTVVYVMDPTGPIDGYSTQRLLLDMRDGSRQVIDVHGSQVAMGQRVQVR